MLALGPQDSLTCPGDPGQLIYRAGDYGYWTAEGPEQVLDIEPPSGDASFKHPTVPVGRELTAAERGVWSRSQLARDRPADNAGLACRVEGEVDAGRLRAAVARLAQLHEALRTIYLGGPEPWAEVRPDLQPQAEMRAMPPGGWQTAAQEAVRMPFDPRQGPLLRVLALRERETTVLILVAHRLICDEVSLRILLRDLAGAYADPGSVAAPRASFSQYARAQASWLAGPGAQRLSAVAGRLAGATGEVILPCAQPPAGPHTSRGGRHEFAFPGELQRAVRKFGANAGATLFETVFTGFAALLQWYGTSDDVVIGMPHARRDDAIFRDCAGLFAHMLGVRIPLGGDRGFRPLLGLVREAIRDAAADSGVAYEDVTVRLRETTGSAPALRVICTQRASAPMPRLGGMPVAELATLNPGVAEGDLVFSAIEEPDGGFSGAFEFAEEAMSLADAQRMAGHLVRLLQCVVTEPDRPVRSLALLAPAEVAWLMRAGAGGAAERNADQPVHQAILEAGAHRPDSVAIWDRAEAVTYAELDRRSAGLARELARLGVRRGDRVALLLPRGVDLGVAILAALRYGVAYVPVDPGYPAERITMILGDCGARAVIARGAVPEARTAGLPAVDLASAPTADGVPQTAVSGEDVAYVLYTSGSTGRPKGVMITHRSLSNYARWFAREFGLGPHDRVLAATTPSFDAFGIELFPALFAGGQVIMAPAGLELDPPALLRLAATQRVTLLATVPTLLRLWVAEPQLERCTGVRHIVCGGEALDWALVHRVFGRLPVPVTNLYGPTEATIDVTYRTCVPGESAVTGATVPIGRPLPGAALAVHRPGGGLAPLGVPGELFISGLPLSLGYLGRPGETAARFQPDPSAGPGARRYATGDRVTWLATGELLFGGRGDGQVKLRGYRMELGEIAAVARGCSGVTDAAAAVLPGRDGKQQLALYVAAATDPDDGAELAQRVLGTVRARLPRQMVPARVSVVPRLPLLPNGKLDLRALNVAHQTNADHAPADPADSAAGRLLRIFRRVLAADDIGYDDSFFERGGDSISAIQAVAQATAAGIQVTLADLLELETVRKLIESTAPG